LQNGLFAQPRRYAQNFILGILTIYLQKNFSHVLILNKNPHFVMVLLGQDFFERIFPQNLRKDKGYAYISSVMYKQRERLAKTPLIAR
jgi:hypothetical protein